jgi:aspartate racemase
MKLLGIIGGTGPETTVEYYRMLIAAFQSKITDGNYPHVLINSINLKTIVDLITAGELAKVTEFLLEEIQRLAAAKADFGLIAANTPHIVFDDLKARTPIPLISIVEATCDAVKDAGFKKVALLGTRFTMKGNFYRSVFEPNGISLLTPKDADQEFIHDRYMNELLKNRILPETHVKLLRIVEQMKETEKIEGVLLAGTELSLILKEESYQGIPFFDTAKIHVNAAIQEMFRTN